MLAADASSSPAGLNGQGGGEETSSESSPLVPPNSSPASNENSSDTLLWDELDDPWPSTFERTISLLASPGVPKEDVLLFTKSPRPGSTPQALARRSNLDRGFYTPERPLFAGLRRGREFNSDHDFQMGIQKVQSLDFPQGVIEAGQAKQMKKAQEAKAYREQLLKKQQGGAAKKKKKKQVVAPKVDKEGKATFSQCAFNLANILMGVGLLGLPFVFRSAGWFGGLACVLVFAVIAWRTSILIGRELNGDPRPASFFDDSPFKTPLPPGSSARSRMLPPITSFPDIARTSFGEVGCMLLSFVLYFELFSCICVFFVSIGDHLHSLFPSIPAKIFSMLTAFTSLFPTVILKTPALLSYLSMVGTFATIALVLAVIASAVFEGNITERVAAKQGLVDAGPYHSFFDSSGLTLAFGLVAYCFSGHAIVPSIYTSMERPQDFEKMVTMTFVVVVICCIAVATSGYIMFGDLVQDQVTLSLEENSTASRAMAALVWLMIMTAFSKITLTMFPLALGMEETVAPYLTSDFWVEASLSIIKIVLTVLALVVSIYVPSFSFLCALVGMICTMAVSIVFPAAAHLKLFGSKLSWTDKVIDWAFVILGVIMAVVGTVSTFEDMGELVGKK